MRVKLINKILIFFIITFPLSSRDCPIFYMRTKVKMELDTQEKRVMRFGIPSW